MVKSDSIQKLLTALFKAQEEFPTVKKEADNPYFRSKYADLVSCLETVTPTLRKNGLMILQFPTSAPAGVGVMTLICHPETGEYIGEEYALPLEKLGAQTGVAAVTYARRVALLAALGIAAEDDDDGETAAGRGKAASKSSTKSAKASAKVGPPKAEIPSSRAVSPSTTKPREDDGSSLTADKSVEYPANDALPTDEQRKKYYERLGKISETIKGIKPPIKTKILRYVYKVTGTTEVEKISVAKWDVFFQVVNAVAAKENGNDELVRLINEAQ